MAAATSSSPLSSSASPVPVKYPHYSLPFLILILSPSSFCKKREKRRRRRRADWQKSKDQNTNSIIPPSSSISLTAKQMERWENKPQPRHRRNSSSFSSSLLDAIYCSIDESDLNLTGGAPDPTPIKYITAPSPAVTRLNYSSSSSYSADSARITRPKPVRTATIQNRPDRTRLDPQPPPQKQKKQLRDHLKKSTSSSPSSPGAKLALFLNSLFSKASNHKKPKISTEDPSPSPSTSNSSASRSCLSKTPSTRRSNGSARSVRFVVDGELTPARGKGRRRRIVEELLKGINLEAEAEAAEESDDDLFELENLARMVTDELPVYETTDMGINSAIAKGLVV